MNVLMLSDHCCIRVVKEGLGLLKAGVAVQWLQQRMANPEVLYAVWFTNFYATREQFDVKVRQFPGLDVVHVHNTPDWMVWRAKELRPELPVVYDVHDLDSVRYAAVNEDERKAFEAADGYVFPSVDYADLARATHPAMANKPALVLQSRCTEEMFQDQQLPPIRGVVFEGGVRAPREPLAPDYPYWMDQGVVAQELEKRHVPFVIYSDGHFGDEYHRLGALCAGPLAYDKLLTQLTRYDWGFVGCSTSHPQWEAAMPNKLFEYLAAGIPVLAYNAGACGRFIEENQFGAVLKKFSDFDRVKHMAPYYRAKVQQRRREFTMEAQIPDLLRFYDEVRQCAA